MIDVDNFKLFNDAHGHVVGDQVLREVARILTTTLRRSDIIARYGGDEFIAALPDTDAEAAVQLAERVRMALKESPFLVDDGRAIPVKMSYGVSTFPYDGSTPAELLAAADANLYRSKRRGGDFITASGGDSSHWPASVGSFSVLDGLVTTVDNKDHYTRRHSEDVTEYALLLAARMDLSVDTQRSLRVAALLHDVGKLGVPDHILRKPAGLSESEFEAIKNHVTLGELIIQGIPNQEEVLQAVSAHHERFDGKGYPRGLKGEEIPLLGRILGVTDAYSAMTTDRPYREALSPAAAKAELKAVAGTQLDPEIVEVFLAVLEDDEATDEARVEVSASRSF
jgi:diguanylate cyclase (GGDEF)-like protein/putative nucleotidyltransferase with HDIG domain